MHPQERYARAYGASAEEYARVLDPTLEPILRRLVELAQVRPGSQVLDIATGTGAAARVAAAAGATVVGVDISPGMIEVARRRSPDNVRFEVGCSCRSGGPRRPTAFLPCAALGAAARGARGAGGASRVAKASGARGARGASGARAPEAPQPPQAPQGSRT